MQEAPVLRPLSVGDIIDRMLRLLRANAIVLFSIAVLPSLIIDVLQRSAGLSQTIDPAEFTALLTPGAPLPRQLQPANPSVLLVVGVVAGFISLIQIGSLTYAIGQRYLGRPVTMREAFAQGLRAVPGLFLAFLVVGVAFGIAFATSLIPVLGALTGLFFIFFGAWWAFASIAVLAPVVVFERLGPIAAVQRSLHLMDKARLRTLGLYVLVGIITIILGIVLGFLFLVSFVAEPTARAVLQTVANVVASCISGPIVYGVLVILYYDLRVRKEAFDLQLAAEALPRDA